LYRSYSLKNEPKGRFKSSKKRFIDQNHCSSSDLNIKIRVNFGSKRVFSHGEGAVLLLSAYTI
jgi:hypothetical protein